MCPAILLHQDNAPVHTSRVVIDTVRGCGYELYPHPPYSPDLAPSDFHFFPKLTKYFQVQKFKDGDELTAAAEDWLADQDVEFHRSGINDWQTRWNKCMELEGDYVEKTKHYKSKYLALYIWSLNFFQTTFFWNYKWILKIKQYLFELLLTHRHRQSNTFLMFVILLIKIE